VDSCGTGQGNGAGSCEDSMEPSFSIKYRLSLDQLNDYKLLKKIPAP
jgi:hypothetical protein